jgi:hypothetical protein
MPIFSGFEGHPKHEDRARGQLEGQSHRS